jgi:diaminopimelate decarboxylase
MNGSAFAYRNGALCAEALPLTEIAEDVETPFYCTSVGQLKQNYTTFAAPFAGLDSQIFYAVRANATLAVIRTLASCGAGAQVTSVGELERALEAGVSPSNLVLSGVGKDRDDLSAALLAGAARIHVESLSELALLQQIATLLGLRAPVALRLNLGLSPQSCGGPSLGLGEGKFGLSLDHLAPALAQIFASGSMMDLKGLAIHIGAHIKEPAMFEQAFTRLAQIVRMCRAQGFDIKHLDLGSGLGPTGGVHDCFPSYVRAVRTCLAPLGCVLSFASGRRLVGDAGVLVTRLLHVKESAGRRFYVVDAGMNDLVRPALYGARHEIIPVRESPDPAPLSRISVVGPVSESNDQFGDFYLMPAASEGDLLAIMHAGAYGSAMASTYNGRALIPEVLVSGADYGVVRRRVAVAEQMEWEAFPDWMDVVDAA